MADQKVYRGDKVTVVRPARNGDQGYDASKDQVLIRDGNGAEQVVLRSEVKDAPA